MQEVTRELQYAGFWVRVLATLIDSLLIVLITFPILWAIYGSNYFSPDNDIIFFGPIDIIISWGFPIVAAVLFWTYKQATPGKMALSLRVLDADTGNSLTLWQGIGRYFAYLVAIIPLFLGLIWVVFDKRKQGWHDKLAGTVVVRTRKGQ